MRKEQCPAAALQSSTMSSTAMLNRTLAARMIAVALSIVVLSRRNIIATASSVTSLVVAAVESRVLARRLRTLKTLPYDAIGRPLIVSTSLFGCTFTALVGSPGRRSLITVGTCGAMNRGAECTTLSRLRLFGRGTATSLLLWRIQYLRVPVTLWHTLVLNDPKLSRLALMSTLLPLKFSVRVLEPNVTLRATLPAEMHALFYANTTTVQTVSVKRKPMSILLTTTSSCRYMGRVWNL